MIKMLDGFSQKYYDVVNLWGILFYFVHCQIILHWLAGLHHYPPQHKMLDVLIVQMKTQQTSSSLSIFHLSLLLSLSISPCQHTLRKFVLFNSLCSDVIWFPLNSLTGKGPNGNLQFRLCPHRVWLWVSAPALICCWRKPLRWQLDKALIINSNLCWDGPKVQKHWLLFQRTEVWFLAPTWCLTSICNSSSREPDAFL